MTLVGPDCGEFWSTAFRGPLNTFASFLVFGQSEPQGEVTLLQQKLSHAVVLLDGFSCYWLYVTRTWVLFDLGRSSN